MSLVTDQDFLLRAFQLSYIRRVLPNHAPQSSRSGTGPYNLINFNASNDDPLSDHVKLSGMSNEEVWPELVSGRSSPPLALTLARDPSRSGGAGGTGRTTESTTTNQVVSSTNLRTNRRRRGGPGPLGYTQTIIGKGSGISGPGMRIDGVKRSYKGKGKALEVESDDEDVASNRLNLVPPVVIHSPVRTPKESPASPYQPNHHEHPHHTISSSSFAATAANLGNNNPQNSIMSELEFAPPPSSIVDPNATVTAATTTAATRKPRFAISANEYHSFPEDRLEGDHEGEEQFVVVESPSSSMIDHDPLPSSSRPGSEISTSAEGGRVIPLPTTSAPTSPISLLPHTDSFSPSPSPDVPIVIPNNHPSSSSPTPLLDSTSTSPLVDDISLVSSTSNLKKQGVGSVTSGGGGEGGEGGNPISMASSGISLFGTSRLDRSLTLTRPEGGDSSDQSEVERRRRRTGRRSNDDRRGGGGGVNDQREGTRERSDSIDSDFGVRITNEGNRVIPDITPTPPLPPSTTTTVDTNAIATPGVPVFKLPPGMKIRERRRVNIRPGMGGMIFVPPTTTVDSTDTSNSAIETKEGGEGKSGRAESPQPGRRGSRSNSAGSKSAIDTEQTTQAVGPKPDNDSAASPRSKRASTTTNLSPLPSPVPGDTEKLAPSSPGVGRSPRRRDGSNSPGWTFPKRSSYIQQPLPSPTSSPSLAPPSPSSMTTATTTQPIVTRKSALTALLTSPSSTSISHSNPFSTLYATCISRSNSTNDNLTLTLYFPTCTKPGPSKPLEVKVKRDVTVEEVIGVGLFSYWEEQEKGEREPKLEVDEDEAESGLETTRWNLRIVEDDGQVDEDFPALDRVRALSAFSFTEFAIIRANDQQVRDNLTKQASITRRPSRILSAPKRVSSGPVPISATLAPPPTQNQPLPNFQTSFALPPATTNANEASFRPAATAAGIGTYGASSALAVPVLLKVQLPPAGPGVGVNTTVQVPSDMYLVDVLDLICRKRSIESSKSWALIVRLSDGDVVVPLDRTVESLGDQHELVLVPRSQVGTVGLRQRRNPQNINPSASIFVDTEEPSTPKYQSASQQLTSTYQLYRVQRKLPMSLGGRHPRTIAIDGDYLHFMPADGKDSTGRTSSFHISLVQSCKVSRRSASSFKIVVHTKNRVDKRYDFEAESSKMANEIVAAVRKVMDSWRAEQIVITNRRVT